MHLIKILGVVRTNAAARAVGPLFEELRTRGHSTKLFAESRGQAKNLLGNSCIELSNEVQLMEAFEDKVDVVVTGLSSDREFEHVAESEAKRRGIPLVQIEDFWGTHLCSKVVPELLLVVDEVAAQMAANRHPHIRTSVVGLPGLIDTTVRDTLRHRLDKVRAETGALLIVYTDSGEEAMETLPLLVESIQKTRAPLLLIPKWNPNTQSEESDSGRTWGERCEEIITPLRETGKVLDVEEPTDQIVSCADLTASGFSVVLFRAASAGKVALTLWTPFVEQLLKVKTGLKETPLMTHGGPTLSKPQPLDEFFTRHGTSIDVASFDPKVAADAVLSLR